VARGDEVLAAVREAEPDVALLDIEMPGETGLQAAERLASGTARHPGADPYHLWTARLPAPGHGGWRLRFPAQGRPGERAGLGHPAGERIVDPGLAAAALSQGECPLTPREHEVLSASRQHATVAELAAALNLSPGTVRNHLSSVMQKLDARNRGEAVQRAEQHGWI
jgi:two-component system response regulator DesR